MRAVDSRPAGGDHLVRRLTLFDSMMLVVSGTVGPSIFIVPGDVLHGIPVPLFALLMWIVVGGVTLIAGLACAELGAMFPEAGGQYVFIREAYGGFPSFLYGWVLFTAGNSTAIASMGIAVALFLGQAVPGLAPDHILFATRVLGVPFTLEQGSVVAVLTIIIVTAINIRSVNTAAWLQNFTALAYLIMVLAIVAVGLAFGHGSWSHFESHATGGAASLTLVGFGVAIIPLFYGYDGWEFLSWVGGEIKNPRRNLPLALITGIFLVIITYLLANIVFLYALPATALAESPTPAAAAVGALFSSHVGRWVALFIALISFGGTSVTVLGGARIYYSMALDGAFFSSMTRLSPRWNTPVTSLVVQCVWVCVLVLSASYDQLYTCFIFMMTLTYVLTVGAVFVLRRTQPGRPRPYRCFGYPWLPSVYIVIASGFVISTLFMKPRESLDGLALAALGAPLYVYWQRRNAVRA